jgi:hypothetical protein
MCGNVIDDIEGAATDAVNTVGGALYDAGTAVVGAASDAASAVGGLVGGAATAVDHASGGLLGNALHKVEGGVVDATLATGSALNDAAKWVGGAIGDAATAVDHVSGGVLNKVEGAILDASQATGGAIGAAAGPIVSVVGDGIGAVAHGAEQLLGHAAAGTLGDAVSVAATAAALSTPDAGPPQKADGGGWHGHGGHASQINLSQYVHVDTNPIPHDPGGPVEAGASAAATHGIIIVGGDQASGAAHGLGGLFDAVASHVAGLPVHDALLGFDPTHLALHGLGEMTSHFGSSSDHLTTSGMDPGYAAGHVDHATLHSSNHEAFETAHMHHLHGHH